MVYAASGIPENICYSTSDKPTGPWKHRGVIMQNNQRGAAFTNHPGVCDYKDKSYFFYHNARLPGGGGFTRSVAVEEFEYKSDGTFPTITMSDQGPAQVQPFDPFKQTSATTFCSQSGIEIERNGNNAVLAYIENGDWVKIKGVDFKTGAKKFTANASSATDGGKIEVKLDSKDGKTVGTCNVPGTGDWSSFKTVECDISGADSKHDLFLVFTGGSGNLFNVDWWQFS